MVPPMPISASVQPNVQISIRQISLIFYRDDAGTGLFDFSEELIRFYGLPGGDFYFLEDSGGRSNDRDLHFHCFHDEDHLVLVEAFAHIFFQSSRFYQPWGL